MERYPLAWLQAEAANIFTCNVSESFYIFLLPEAIKIFF